MDTWTMRPRKCVAISAMHGLKLARGSNVWLRTRGRQTARPLRSQAENDEQMHKRYFMVNEQV